VVAFRARVRRRRLLPFDRRRIKDIERRTCARPDCTLGLGKPGFLSQLDAPEIAHIAPAVSSIRIKLIYSVNGAYPSINDSK
jgi:hypothetical protein